MSRNRHVVVINQEFHVEILQHRKTCSLRVVSLHLRSVTSQTEHDLVLLRERYAVDVRPHVTETSRTELNTRSHTQFRMTGKMSVSSSVLHKTLRLHVSSKYRHDVLRRDSMSGFVKESRDELIRSSSEERVHQDHLRHCIVRSSRMSSVSRR